MPSKSEYLRPRHCELAKGENGYGFHLHGEKGRAGQFIRLVEPDSPSETSGLRAGDRLVFVNGDNVEHESHQQVVSRIRATAGALELVVVDVETDQLLKKHGLECLGEYVEDGLPLPLDESDREEEEEEEDEEVTEEHQNGNPLADSPLPETNGDSEVDLHVHVEKKLSTSNSEIMEEVVSELRPRLCVILRGSGGYGFNLHSERARPGQYVRAVDSDSPAERAGLQPNDRIVQVNGRCVEGRSHSEVVEAIKAGAGETRLLVVDPDTDRLFRSCGVAPSPGHLTGPLPEPGLNGAGEGPVRFQTENGGGASESERERDSKMSISPSPSNASSNASFTPPPAHTPPEDSEPEALGSIPELSLSLQQVKERAHQKRSNKRAPTMDWTKKKELFSNL
ncbi:Na(+)/H(+) exchange regulatory cofactor NHE-RF1 [Gadus chalcogrammus]|uniref:Na(+)/H(+) exchange regulatory cofactor NHE-RF1 n=1 Tax=Gadus chalcogrammus TaxID=1042646 RepID=UPI0024C20D6A|nr:Na(+)/H(+) exchange regulatory cofactor NHE-RF1 [Gadus chalcogrammus]